MKLLIVTQVIDTQHPILGFFHRWVIEFAKHFEHIHVIALYVGEHELPQNVSVHSLGKENGVGKFEYIKRFYAYAWKLRNEYDAVFVHMNPEYIFLFGIVWKLLRKKVALWYNHTVGSLWLRLSAPCVDVHIHTSPYAYPARYKDAVRMPAGIDTEVFKPHPEIQKIPKSIYFQGRLAPAKNIHIILEAFAILQKEGKASLLTLVGPEISEYIEPLKEKYKNLIDSGAVVFKGSVKHSETPQLFAAHTVSVNLTAPGNYDKSVLESILSGTPVVLSSDAFSDIVPDEWIVPENDLDALTDTLQKILSLNDEQKQALNIFERKTAEQRSLVVLGKDIQSVFKDLVNVKI